MWLAGYGYVLLEISIYNINRIIKMTTGCTSAYRLQKQSTFLNVKGHCYLSWHMEARI